MASAARSALTQLFQIIAGKNLREVPGVLVSGAKGSAGMMEALMAMMAGQQQAKAIDS